DDRGPLAKTARQVGRHVVLAPRDMDVEAPRPAEGNDPRVEPVNERPQGNKVKLRGIGGRNREGCHNSSDHYEWGRELETAPRIPDPRGWMKGHDGTRMSTGATDHHRLENG